MVGYILLVRGRKKLDFTLKIILGFGAPSLTCTMYFLCHVLRVDNTSAYTCISLRRHRAGKVGGLHQEVSSPLSSCALNRVNEGQMCDTLSIGHFT